LKQLFGARDFQGTIGFTDFQLKLQNGPTISGRLDEPVDQKSAVSGRGRWGSSQITTPLRLQGCQDRY
ncbi:hypothetical protein DFQ27_007949, partial [Actinomortierella ambigua]